MQIPQKYHIFPLFLMGLCLWGALIYSNSLHAPFVFDDEEYIVRNPAIRNLSDGRLWQTQKYRKRIVAFVSFALNYRLHALDVTGYHLVNISIHVINSLLVAWLAWLLLGTPRMRGQPVFEARKLISGFCGVLFLSHPVQTQAVTYISQRFESLAALFYLLALCAYLKAKLNSATSKQYVFYGLVVDAALFGLFTKETVFTLPISIFLIEGLFFESKFTKKRIGIFTGIIMALFVMGSFFFPGILNNISRYTSEGMTSQSYFLVQGRVLIKYLQLWFFPIQQNLDYDFHLAAGPAPVIAAFVILIALVAVAVRYRRLYVLVSFGIFWFFITLAPTSSFMPMLDVIVEHRLYLAAVGLTLASVSFIFMVLKKRSAVLLLSILILVFSFLTYQRNSVWADEVTLWQDTANKSPKTRVYANLAKAYQKRKDYDMAFAFYSKALEVSPNSLIASQLCVEWGALFAEKGDYEKQIFYTQKAVELNPNDSQAHSNLGYAYSMLGKHEAALDHAKEAVRLSPDFDAAWNNLGVIYAHMGQYENAVKSFEKTLKLNPYHEKARENFYAAQTLLSQHE